VSNVTGVLMRCYHHDSLRLRSRFGGGAAVFRADGESKPSGPKITSFFFGGESGDVFYADDMGHCAVVTDDLHSAISVMEFYEEKHHLVIITQSLQLLQLRVGDDGTLSTVQRVKLSMKGSTFKSLSCWVGPGLLATTSPDESMLHVFDLDTSENYHLGLSSANTPIPRSDRLAALAYNPRMSVLAAGTREGRVVMWKHYQSARSEGQASSSAAHWEGIHTVQLNKPVQTLSWGPGSGLLGCLMFDDATVLNETVLHRKLAAGNATIQTSRDRLVYERPKSSSLHVRASINIKVGERCLACVRVCV